jgi:hypothetical protein
MLCLTGDAANLRGSEIGWAAGDCNILTHPSAGCLLQLFLFRAFVI